MKCWNDYADSGVSFTPFSIALQGKGCFLDLWWAGMEESSALAAVASRIRRVLAEIRGGLRG